MNPTILFRTDESTEEEFSIASQHLRTVRYRTEVRPDDIVICRYSALPFYSELEQDVKNIGARLVNSYAQHRWIANFSWYMDLKDFTPETWFDENISSCTYPGPFIVKGRTNSKKSHFSTHMYAKDRSSALAVAGELASDPIIGPQGFVYRKYVELETTGERLLGGLPVTNEHRFFILGRRIIAHGYYWSGYSGEFSIDDDALTLVRDIAKIAAENCNFYVLDIGRTSSGEWILIEVNDGQMSGLSAVNPHTLYSAVSTEVGNLA